MGIRVCGYVFFHDHVEMCKRNKQQLARNIRKLQKKGLDEEQIRIRQSSLIGFVKHADTVNLFKKLGMEKTLGKIIKKRRVKPPFLIRVCNLRLEVCERENTGSSMASSA